MFKCGAALSTFSFSLYLPAMMCALVFWLGLGSPVWAGTGWSRCDAKIATASKAGKITVVSTCNRAGRVLSQRAPYGGAKKVLNGGPTSSVATSKGATAFPSYWTKTDRWAWTQIKEDKTHVADLNINCDTSSPLDPKEKEHDGLWEEPCRGLSASFVQDLLTQETWKEAVPFEGVRIIGAKINGDIDLEDAKLTRRIIISNSRIDGKIKLGGARTDNLISLEGSVMNQGLNATGLHSESDLNLTNIVSDGEVTLMNAKIAGDVEAFGARIAWLSADYSHIGGSLNMLPGDQGGAGVHVIHLQHAKIGGDLVMAGVNVDGPLYAEDLHVVGSLDMRCLPNNTASFQYVNLADAKIDGSVEMAGADFEGELNGNSLQVGGTLSMSRSGWRPDIETISKQKCTDKGTHFTKAVDLGGADIKKQLHIFGALFEDELQAHHMHVGDDLFIRNTRFDKDVDMNSAHVDGSLDLRGATLANFDLQGTSVQGYLRVGKNKRNNKNSDELAQPNEAEQPIVWNGVLNLRNTQVGYLADAQDAWPKNGQVFLNGFTFAHLGDGTRVPTQSILEWLAASLGLATAKNPDDDERQGEGVTTREDGMLWWDHWARRDRYYSPTPYVQTAAALTNLGYRDERRMKCGFSVASGRARRLAGRHGWDSWDCLVLCKESSNMGSATP